jgi:hypothetical protein
MISAYVAVIFHLSQLDSDSSLTTFNAVTTLSAIDAMDIVSSEDAEDEIENCTLDDAASVPKSKGRGKATTTTTEGESL